MDSLITIIVAVYLNIAFFQINGTILHDFCKMINQRIVSFMAKEINCF